MLKKCCVFGGLCQGCSTTPHKPSDFCPRCSSVVKENDAFWALKKCRNRWFSWNLDFPIFWAFSEFCAHPVDPSKHHVCLEMEMLESMLLICGECVMLTWKHTLETTWRHQLTSTSVMERQVRQASKSIIGMIHPHSYDLVLKIVNMIMLNQDQHVLSRVKLSDHKVGKHILE